MKVLAGDLGGTKTLLLVADCGPGTCIPLREQRYESATYEGLLPMVEEFLGTLGRERVGIERACFGVAGPVAPVSPERQRARITNLPWELDTAQLAGDLELRRVRLINDFQAVGYGVEALQDDDLVTLQRGEPVHGGPRVVIGAGTGLGEGLLLWHADHYEALASEGGHVDFAPTDAEQDAVLEGLRREYGRVSYERVLSGPGLVNVFRHLPLGAGETPSAALQQALTQGDPAAAISEFAQSGRDAIAQRALTCFIRIYGAQSGNLALTVMATGGVFLAGGIAAKILPQLREGPFLDAFLDKGRMGPLLKRFPIHVIRNPRVGLLGAALAASRL
ncbi:MAG: glucokinase [Chromatiales bacterium 21-64-14]|nr:MAG: glucokinase [Chromatiales bacterium 21-64-14]HQU16576.1 glucokinase [Gammaproteobacteria bacterium]